MQRRLDRGDVQAIILAAYKYPVSRHLFFAFGDAKGGRAFLAKLVPYVTHGTQDIQAQPEPLLNIGLRTSTRTSESPCARASCGDVTRGGGILM
jgi:hypothetical protein